MTRQAVGVDVGGTKIAALRIGEDGRVLERLTAQTPATDQEAVVREMATAAAALASDEVVAVGVGAAGLVDRAGVVRYSPNIAWRDMPVRERMSAASGLPCVVENDASMAGVDSITLSYTLFAAPESRDSAGSDRRAGPAG